MDLKSFSSAILPIMCTHVAVPSASKTLRTQPQASQRRMVWFGDDRIPVFCGVILLVVLQFDSFMLTEFARNEIHRKRTQNKSNSTDCDKTLLGKFIISLYCSYPSMPSRFFMYHQVYPFKLSPHCPHKCICVLYIDFITNSGLFPYTALTDWFCKRNAVCTARYRREILSTFHVFKVSISYVTFTLGSEFTHASSFTVTEIYRIHCTRVYYTHVILIINEFYSFARGLGSSVGIATDYGLDGPG